MTSVEIGGGIVVDADVYDGCSPKPRLFKSSAKHGDSERPRRGSRRTSFCPTLPLCGRGDDEPEDSDSAAAPMADSLRAECTFAALFRDAHLAHDLPVEAEASPCVGWRWQGLSWLLRVDAGAWATVEAHFTSGELLWAAEVREDRSTGLHLRATLECNNSVRLVQEGRGDSFGGHLSKHEDEEEGHGGHATLRLALHNKGKLATTAEVIVVPRRASVDDPRCHLATFATDASAVHWASDLLLATFLQKDLQLKAAKLEVVEVQRITHAGLWQSYVQRRRELAEELAPERTSASAKQLCTPTKLDPLVPLPLDAGSNEHWLFHGTSPAAARSIAAEDFAISSVGIHGRSFGDGLYFAECSSKADLYSSVAYSEVDGPESEGLCCMLLCRVALGRARTVPDVPGSGTVHLMKDAAGDAYHSVVGDRERMLKSYREFIVHDPLQVNPEFIIWYRRRTESAVQRWATRLRETYLS